MGQQEKGLGYQDKVCQSVDFWDRIINNKQKKRNSPLWAAWAQQTQHVLQVFIELGIEMSCNRGFLLYLFSMIQGTGSYYQQDNSEKYKALTPATADSFPISPVSTRIFDPSQNDPTHHCQPEETLFAILEQRFQSKLEDAEGSKMQKEQSKNVVEEHLQQCQFKIVINIAEQKGKLVKSFSKKIMKTIEVEKEITLIFDRQYQKLKIEANTKYIIDILIETLDGFSKRIWDRTLNLEDSQKRWSVMTVSSQNQDKFLNMEVQKIGKFFVKPLSLKLPLATLEEFFDFKFKLLNKSDLLSTLKSVSQLKGILSPLTKQNMGSRIIQKLLTKASQHQIQSVISELKSIFKEMILDRYGNYVFQKIFKVATKTQKNQCLKNLQPFMIELLQSKEGTHCIQTLVDYLDLEEAIAWFSGFSPEEIFELSTNKFSMHFIKKLLSIMPQGYLTLTLISRFNELAVDKQGIVVLKALLSYSANNQDNRYAILAACQQCLNQIAFTEFGHYIVEEMFLSYNYYELQNILNYMATYISFFAQNQYSSSIVRKAIEIYGDCISIPIINRVLQGGLVQIMECSSGEFVLHRLMELTVDEEQKKLLMNEMMVLSQEVKCYQKRQKWLKYFKLI